MGAHQQQHQQQQSVAMVDLRPSRAIEDMRAEQEAELTFLPDIIIKNDKNKGFVNIRIKSLRNKL